MRVHSAYIAIKKKKTRYSFRAARPPRGTVRMNILITHTDPALRRRSFCNVDAGQADVRAAYRFFYPSKCSKYSRRRIPDNRPNANPASLVGATLGLVKGLC